MSQWSDFLIPGQNNVTGTVTLTSDCMCTHLICNLNLGGCLSLWQAAAIWIRGSETDTECFEP